MTETNQASVHELAFHFWDKDPEKYITSEDVSKTLFWLIDTINSGKLEAWHNAKKVKDIKGFAVNPNNASEVLVNFLVFRAFLNKSMDDEFEKYSDWEKAKKSWTRPIGTLGDPQKDLILYLGLIPEKIKQKLLDQYTALKKERTTEQDKTKAFPCDLGTKWDEIEMALLPAGDKFMVKTPLGHGYYDHIDLRLHNQRTKSKIPKILWHFLKQLAKMNGFFPLKGVQNFEKISSNAKRLNKNLQQLFGIEESIYKDRCDKIGGYETKFKISSIPDDAPMVNRKSLIDEELEDPIYNNIKESSYYPEHSTFKKE